MTTYRASLIVASVEIPIGGEYKSRPSALAAARRAAGQVFMREPVTPPAVSLRVYASDWSSDYSENVNPQYKYGR
jgi:hypothetical protein